MAALTDTERARILRHLGYADWSSLALAWGWTFPTSIPPDFEIRDALTRLTDEALELVRSDLRECDEIEAQMKESRCRLKAGQVGDIKLNPQEFRQLQQMYAHWRQRLADDFNAHVNPFSGQNNPAGGGINAKVIHG